MSFGFQGSFGHRKSSRGLAARPIKRSAAQVRHGQDMQGVGAHVVNDGVREAGEVEFAMVAPNFAPAFRIGHDSAQGEVKLIQEVVAKARVRLLLPQRHGLQLRVGFRMADDAHGACRGSPPQPAPPGGN